jgi:hypothetical protein
MQRKLLSLVLLVVLLATTAGSALAAEDYPLAPEGEDQACYPWYGDLDEWPFLPGLFYTTTGKNYTIDALLGDQVVFAFQVWNANNLPATFWPVDIYLWRPPTTMFCEFPNPDLDGFYRFWPLLRNIPTFTNGWNIAGAELPWWPFWTTPSWWLGTLDGGATDRRQTWPDYVETDGFGWYYAKFMLPRDEGWYPCGYPCKWNCHFYNPMAQNIWTFHSPWALVPVYPAAVPFTEEWYYPDYFPLYWPFKYYNDGVIDAFYGDNPNTPFDEAMPYQWIELFPASDPGVFYQVVLPSLTDPQDTIHPITAWAVERAFGSTLDTAVGGDLPWWEAEIMGYYWKTTDLKWQDWPADWPFLCEDHEWPWW